MISPAIHFPGNCAQAMALYQKVFNATDIYVEYYHEAPPGSGIPVTGETRDFVMHAGMTICGTHINMSDTLDAIVPGNMILLNVFFNSAGEVSDAFNMLKEGGKVFAGLGPQFFSPMYGSVEDRFGVRWQLITNRKE